MADYDKMLTLKEVAEKLNVAESTLQQWVRAEEFPAVKILGVWRVKERDLLKVVQYGVSFKTRKTRGRKSGSPKKTKTAIGQNNPPTAIELKKMIGEDLLDSEEYFLLNRFLRYLKKNILVSVWKEGVDPDLGGAYFPLDVDEQKRLCLDFLKIEKEIPFQKEEKVEVEEKEVHPITLTPAPVEKKHVYKRRHSPRIKKETASPKEKN